LNYLLLIGQQVPSEDWRDLIGKALQLPNVIILSESHGNAHGLGAIDQIDRWIMALTDDQSAHLQWDVVISLGHNVISRKVKTLIKAKCKAHWSVQFQKDPINTYRLNPKLFHCTSVQFLENWLPKDLYGEGHVQHQINANHTMMLDDYFSQRMHSDLKLFYHLSIAFPPHAMIQAGNSSVVRYLQLMSQRSDLVYYGNRGVSGIDGATSTAVGASRISARPVILVTGDLSFLYDANGLWMDQWPRNLKIVVVDNGGGGIFRIIEGAKEEPTVPVFFETPHGRDIVKWVRGWGWNAQELIESNVERLKDFFNDDQSQVLVIKTPAEVNPIELDLFFQFFKEYNERMENHQRIH
jgi:2-succinyl-5-enolpyruvyl-6-hydroxy-3-cyclohexene-1-carboxylate synthase